MRLRCAESVRVVGMRESCAGDTSERGAKLCRRRQESVPPNDSAYFTSFAVLCLAGSMETLRVGELDREVARLSASHGLCMDASPACERVGCGPLSMRKKCASRVC